MRKDDGERWTDDADLDRMQATPRGVAGGWLVVILIAGLMLVVPPTVDAADQALDHARQSVRKVERKLAQVVPRLVVDRARPC
jgi:hypothetical protein